MLKLSIDDIIDRINNEQVFSCTSEDGSFSIYITEYVPYICAAIHNGSNLRKELRSKCALTKSERWYEEDPHTADFISGLPIRIIGNDSRYEYDLNRDSRTCVFDEAWGKKVWKEPLADVERKYSLEKHRNFYRVVDTLIKKIEKKYKACLVYDVHSYNYKRIDEAANKPVAPMFNIGTEKLSNKFRPTINDWIERLSNLESEYFINQTRENDVFFGRGNFLGHITTKFKNTLVLATEVRKSYCDEQTGDIFPEVIEDISIGMRKAILENAKVFIDKRCNFNVKQKHTLLNSKIEPIVKQIDSEIAKIAKTFDILEYVNPKNLEQEKRKFFKSKFKVNPEFKYAPLDIDVFEFKRNLYQQPVDSIHDTTLRRIYRDVIESYVDQIELLYFRGEERFKYMSLKLFGEPSKKDLEVARLLLQVPDIVEDDRVCLSDDAIKNLKDEIKVYGFSGKVELSKNIPSSAVFFPAKKLLKLKKGIKFTHNFRDALCHHEIGVHMLTTENALLQPLEIFQIGLPLDTLTQEGLAIASEYSAGLLSISRLKELALRVMAVNHMLKVNDFKETFSFLVDRYGIDEQQAFYLCTRVYRGGGFTKDYLNLYGFRMIKEFLDKKRDVRPLLIGKTAIEYYPLIKELIERDILSNPKYITKSFDLKNVKKDDILEYLLQSLNE